jgi:hypothetical protein
MAPLNHTLEEAEYLALHEVIAQEETIIENIRKVQREHEAKHQLLAEKSIILQRTLDSTEILREVGSQLCTHFMPLLVQLETQLAIQEDDQTILSTHFPSTPTFINSWGVLKDGIITLHASLKQQLDRTQERITSITQQLYSTESLRDQMPSTIFSFSSMIEHAQESIKAKKGGILHPIRRLPMEILLHIFEDCVNDEINEYHRNPPSIFEARPTMALCLASVCGRWRDIMLGTPHLWRHLRLRAPTPLSSPGAGKHFQNYLDRCRGSEIELTIPTGGELSDDLLPDTIMVRRLNLSANILKWPIVPSPVHLWLHHPQPSSGWVIPSRLISRTTHLTVWNVGISFQRKCKSLTRLEICGVHPASIFMQMIRQSPHLTDLDLIKSEMQDATLLEPVSFTHLHLRYLGLSSEWINRLESALSSGLHLSQLRHLELSNITSEYMATMYPFISAQLGATVVRLDFQGEDCSFDATRSFIDAFRRVDTIGCYGSAAETVLGALYDVRTSQVQTPGEDTIRCTREVAHAMPKGLEVVIIRDYEGEGRKIEQRLRMMRQNPAADTQPIHVVFENCLNILPRIRKEFAVSGPLVVIESEQDLESSKRS